MSNIRQQLVPKCRTIFFDEEAHKYSNELGFVYTSTTTVIGKYVHKQDFEETARICERIGRNPSHPKYLWYKGYTAKQLLDKWSNITKEACDFGSKTHNFLETSVRKSTNYNLDKKGFINGRIYTIDDIMYNKSFGRLKVNDLVKMGLAEKYPKIYNILIALHKKGFYIYAEIGVYDDDYGVSGLIDILCVNHDTFEFVILDWKTNKAPLRFDSGHYEKKVNGLLDLDKWKANSHTFQEPLQHIPDSVGYHYTLQLSIYAYLVTTFGYTFKGLLLCHIRPVEDYFKPREQWEEIIELYKLTYLEQDVKLLLSHFRANNTETQGKLIFN